MQDLFVNPLNNPIFNEVMTRFIWAFVIGFFLILILNKLRLKGLWKTNVGERYLSWFWIGLIFVITIMSGRVTSLIFLVLVMFLALWELVDISKMPKVYFYALCLLGLISLGVVYFFPDKFYMLPILYFTILTSLTIRRNDKNGFFKLSTSFYASIWIIFFLCHFTLLAHLNASIDNTRALLLLIGFAVPLADIGAYVIGKSFSKTPLDKFKIASNISPKKSWAGMLGNILGAGLGIYIMYFAIGKYFSINQMVILAVLIGIFSVIGDMNESLIKRYFGVKDSSKILPGHGGILDRIDSIIRVIVVVFYFSAFIL